MLSGALSVLYLGSSKHSPKAFMYEGLFLTFLKSLPVFLLLSLLFPHLPPTLRCLSVLAFSLYRDVLCTRWLSTPLWLCDWCRQVTFSCLRLTGEEDCLWVAMALFSLLLSLSWFLTPFICLPVCQDFNFLSKKKKKKPLKLKWWRHIWNARKSSFFHSQKLHPSK